MPQLDVLSFFSQFFWFFVVFCFLNFFFFSFFVPFFSRVQKLRYKKIARAAFAVSGSTRANTLATHETAFFFANALKLVLLLFDTFTNKTASWFFSFAFLGLRSLSTYVNTLLTALRVSF